MDLYETFLNGFLIKEIQLKSQHFYRIINVGRNFVTFLLAFLPIPACYDYIGSHFGQGITDLRTQISCPAGYKSGFVL
jgi:hypothetical protein